MTDNKNYYHQGQVHQLHNSLDNQLRNFHHQQQSHQPFNQGYYQPHQQPVISQANYHSYSDPVDNPHNISIAGPVEPVLELKERFGGIYKLMWFAMIASIVLFCWYGYYLLSPFLEGYSDILYSFDGALFIIQVSFQVVAVICTWRLIKGFQTTNAKAFLQGRIIFFVLAIYETFFAVRYFPELITLFDFIIFLSPATLSVYVFVGCCLVGLRLQRVGN